MHYVTDVAYAGAYKLSIRFEDNETKIVDLCPHLDGSVFEPLKGTIILQVLSIESRYRHRRLAKQRGFFSGLLVCDWHAGR